MADQKLPAHKCANCQGKACQRCSSCQSIGKECQRKDWPSHICFCSLTYPDKDPKEKSVRAILLPAESPIPQFVEVPYEIFQDGDEEFLEPSEELLGTNTYSERSLRRYKNDTDADRILTVLSRGLYLSDGSIPSQSVAAITKGVNTQYWRGPILIFRSDNVASVLTEDIEYVDIEKEDTKEVVAFFLEEKNLYRDVY